MEKNTCTNLIEVEKYLIKNGSNVSNKKLQKLLYFSQGWFLALNNDEEDDEELCNYLFEDDISAWRHGPVIVSTYHRFKKHGFLTIDPNKVGEPNLDENTSSFLDQILQVYDCYSADQLEYISHQQDPWKNTYNPSKRNETISAESMYNFFVGEMNA